VSGGTSGAPKLAVTGATGRVGSRVAQRLAAAGVPLRLVVRDPSRAPELPGAVVAVAEYADAGAARAALEGVETLFMVSGAEEKDRVATHRTFVDAAVAAGVRHVVYTSFFGAAPDCTFTLGRDHWATEEHLRASGLTWTFLRDNLYLDFVPYFAGEDGVIRGPAGDGRMAGVAIDDVADVAAAVLRDPAAHAGQAYPLTGPQSLTLAEAAEIVTAAGDRAITYHAETVPEAYASRASYGAPSWQVDAWVSTYTAIAKGELDGVTPHVERLTGHPARSLAELAAAPAI
jgi:NAD(P)H dehydrogenase (quinone)